MEGSVSAAAPAAAGNVTPAGGATDAAAAQETTGGATEAKGGKGAKSIADAFEEIAVGGVKGKVPAGLAKAIKELERGAQEKFQKSSQIQKEAKQFTEWAKANPKEFLKMTGLDPYEFAEATLTEKLQLMQETPEQKELRELREYRAKVDKEAKEREERDRQTKDQQEYEAASKQFHQDFLSAWEESGLPPDPYFGQRMAAKILAARKQGRDLSPKQAAAIIKQDFGTNAKDILSKLEAQAIADLLGEDILKKLRQLDVDRVTGKAAPTASSNPRPGHAPASDKPKQSQRVVTEKEWDAFWES